MEDPPLYFFLSYARADNGDGPFLARFFRDLRHEVRVRSGHRDADAVGFLDVRSIRPGESWSKELSLALARCRTFVALCSPSFFASEYCGREWTVFDRRLGDAAATGLVRSPALLPVIWTPLRHLPDALAALQYDHSDLGELYARFGLRYLLQLKRNHDAYQEFLVALSDRIVRLAEESPLPPMAEIPSLDGVDSAFESPDPAFRDPFPLPGHRSGRRGPIDPVRPPDPTEPLAARGEPWRQGRRPRDLDAAPGDDGPGDVGRTGERPVSGERGVQPERGEHPGGHGRARTGPGGSAPAGGPRRITFVLAVTSAEEMASLRSQLDYYGSQFDEWMPYHPRHSQRVCVAAQMVAAAQGMTSNVVMLRTGISQMLERSRARNELVVILVDLWTAMIGPFRDALAEYDGRNEPTTGVLVPWNPDDSETHENADRLLDALVTALHNNVLRQDKLFRMDVRSHEEFDRALVQVIADSQARIFAHETVFRRRGESSRRRPFLEGP